MWGHDRCGGKGRLATKINLTFFVGIEVLNFKHPQISKKCSVKDTNIFDNYKASEKIPKVFYKPFVYVSKKRSHFADPGKRHISTFWKKGQNIRFLDFHWFWQKKGWTFIWHLRLFESTFHSCTKVHCLRTKICWSIQFHIVKKKKTFKKPLSQNGLF